MTADRIKAVLFDMDGVLIDAKDWHYEALNRALELFGFAIERQAHLSTFDGLPTRRKLQMLSATQGLPVGLHGLINELKQAYTIELSYSKCRPILELLVETKGGPVLELRDLRPGGRTELQVRGASWALDLLRRRLL